MRIVQERMGLDANCENNLTQLHRIKAAQEFVERRIRCKEKQYMGKYWVINGGMAVDVN